MIATNSTLLNDSYDVSEIKDISRSILSEFNQRGQDAYEFSFNVPNSGYYQIYQYQKNNSTFLVNKQDEIGYFNEGSQVQSKFTYSDDAILLVIGQIDNDTLTRSMMMNANDYINAASHKRSPKSVKCLKSVTAQNNIVFVELLLAMSPAFIQETGVSLKRFLKKTFGSMSNALVNDLEAVAVKCAEIISEILPEMVPGQEALSAIIQSNNINWDMIQTVFLELTDLLEPFSRHLGDFVSEILDETQIKLVENGFGEVLGIFAKHLAVLLRSIVSNPIIMNANNDFDKLAEIVFENDELLDLDHIRGLWHTRQKVIDEEKWNKIWGSLETATDEFQSKMDVLEKNTTNLACIDNVSIIGIAVGEQFKRFSYFIKDYSKTSDKNGTDLAAIELRQLMYLSFGNMVVELFAKKQVFVASFLAGFMELMDKDILEVAMTWQSVLVQIKSAVISFKSDEDRNINVQDGNNVQLIKNEVRLSKVLFAVLIGTCGLLLFLNVVQIVIACILYKKRKKSIVREIVSKIVDANTKRNDYDMTRTMKPTMGKFTNLKSVRMTKGLIDEKETSTNTDDSNLFENTNQRTEGENQTTIRI